MASNALTTIEHGTLPTARDWETMLSMSEVLVKSGMLPAHIKSAAAAVAIIQKGRELGIQPMYALSNIVNIQGKPTANAELMLALIYRDHGDNAITFTHSDNTACQIAYARRSWKQPQSYSFTIEDAKAAGLLSNQTWQKYPAAMLRARCISAVARMAFPDSIGGMYTAEELGAEVDEDGTPIQAHVEPPREIRSTPSTPIEQPRSAPLSAPRAKATVLPNGREQAAAKLIADAAAKGVTLDPDDSPALWADDVDAALDAAGSTHRVPRDEQGTPLAGALSKALFALPRREIDAETGEVREEDETLANVGQGTVSGTGR
jgi:hypothetical protein